MNDEPEPRTNIFPPGWDEQRVRRILDYYESPSEDDVLEELMSAFEQEEPPA